MEQSGRAGSVLPDEEVVCALVFDGLVRVNQDFREVSRLFLRSQVHVKIHAQGTGPFTGKGPPNQGEVHA